MLKLGRQPKIEGKPSVSSSGSISDQDFAMIRDLLYQEAGIVLNDSKRSLVEARLARRIRTMGLNTYGQYIARVKQDPQGDELVHLIDVISTNVTHFFRENDHFELINELMSRWVADGTRRLRFWSAACSSGEEPYSLAMTLAPYLEKNDLDVKILGTDISTRVLEQAVTGVFEPDRVEKIPSNIRARFFHKVQVKGREAWEVDPRLKALMMFHRLNFTRFPYPINGVFDVIFCRNAMIYFDKNLRTRMVREFSRLLKPGGYLLIGHAETLIGVEDAFVTVRPSVYRHRNPGEGH